MDCEAGEPITMKTNCMRRWPISLILAVVFALNGFAQKPEPQTPPPPPGVQQGQKESATTADRKITDAEAQELFKSFDEILAFASRDTGLPIKSPVKHKIVSRDEVEKYMLERMKDDPDAARLERSEISIKKFGLIPKDMNLRNYMVALLKEQIAGFYDSKTKVMYLLDWVTPEGQKPVLAHELTHALQDQNYDLEKWGQVNEDKLSGREEMVRDEQRAARQAVVEGQATLVLVDYLLQPYGKTVVTAPEVVDMLKQQMVGGGSTPLFSRAPLFLKQALLFPYDAGFDFERAVLTAGGKLQGFAGTMGNPPVDTRQIMEPKTYIDQQRFEIPKLADLQAVVGKTYEKFDDGGFGEFDVQILVKQWMPSSPDPSQPQSEVAAAAKAAADGSDKDLPLIHAWRGGYYMSFRKRDGKDTPVCLAFIMHLATPKDAKDFETVYRSGLKQRYKSLTMKTPGKFQTEEGPVILASDGEWFTATEGFDAPVSQKLRDAMLQAAKQGSASKAAAN
jgi:hypothetical protein